MTLILKTKDLLKLILKTKRVSELLKMDVIGRVVRKNKADPENKGLTEVDPDNKGVTSSDPENKGVSLFPHSSPKAGLSGPPPSFQGPEKVKGAAFGCAF